ncbi:ferrous iron transport protein A [uncultured Vagococcus sp.]|uniref:FeoA family protein n=1 Tax=uncultured Vagococcus sp. TaxID=189676 RepID=UPI0028D8E424|nr:ferrous iron transport protein A [uncultured Vagococcus sp.]
MLNLQEGSVGILYYFEEVINASTSDRHLANLGFVKGAKIRIISQDKRGDLIISVKDARLAISQKVASQVKVSTEHHQAVSYQTLDSVSIGAVKKIENVLGGGVLRRRLMDMGLTRGVDVMIRKVAPLGDPIEVTIRGYELTLRKAEAELVLVKDV